LADAAEYLETLIHPVRPEPVEGQPGFDKACPEFIEGLSPNGVLYILKYA